MRDAKNPGHVDPRFDHHMIGGQLVRVTEPGPTRAQKSRSTKRNTGEKRGKGASATPAENK